MKTAEFLNRWIDKIYPSKEQFLRTFWAKKLTIYHWIDPTAPHLHLGHSTNLLLLRRFQELGHKIVLLVGDFTAQIGDPTGKSTTRRALTKKEVLRNCRTYKEQAGKILDFKAKNPAEFKLNSQWLGKLTPAEIVSLTANFTHGQMIKRSMFQKRLKRGEEIYLHEFLYPLFQAYDSVALSADVEVGGTDQTFNMMMGRDLIKIFRQKEKFVIATPLLENPNTGKKLMSKSEGNFIALDDVPQQMYGKIMALPDETITSCLKLCTEITLPEIQKIERGMKLNKINPKEAKLRLAREVVKMYHGEKEARRAEKEFERVFKLKKTPSRVPAVKIKEKKLSILDLLVRTKLVSSRSEAKRLVLQKGVKIDGKVEGNWQKTLEIKKGIIIQIGKRKFIKLS